VLELRTCSDEGVVRVSVDPTAITAVVAAEIVIVVVAPVVTLEIVVFAGIPVPVIDIPLRTPEPVVFSEILVAPLAASAAVVAVIVPP
jgi:hypothetical protein